MRVNVALYCALFLVCAFWATPNVAQNKTSVQAIALFNNKAMLSVNGKKAKIIKVGESLHGVKLLASSTEQAEVEFDGTKENITLNSAVLLSTKLAAKPGQSDSAQLWADQSGFFRGQGSIGGRSLEFLVDTGANLVVLSSQQADQIGLSYQEGFKTYASTASGNAPMYAITLDQISFQGIELRGVQAGIIQGAFPEIPLLGMSFLKRLDMNRSGDQMDLKKRY